MIQKIKNQDFRNAFICCVILFVYGCLVLMIGYTNTSLHSLTGLNGGKLLYLSFGQSFGLILAVFYLKEMIKHFNLRTILLINFGLATAMLALISQIDHISDSLSKNSATSFHTNSIILFTVFTFILGFSIGSNPGITSTYFGSIKTGKKRSTTICLSNSLYSIGGGIIPLVFAHEIVSSTNSDYTSFNSVRGFYYIALGLAAFGFINSLFIYYRHQKQHVSAKILHKQTKIENEWSHKMFMIIIILAFFMMFFYLMSETIINFSYAKFVSFNQNDNKTTIRAYQNIGIVLMFQGFGMIFHGLTTTKIIKYRTYICLNACLLILMFVLIAIGLLKYQSTTYLISVFVGLGLGALWPIIFSYGLAIDSRRSAYIGIWLQKATLISLFVTQIISAFLFTTKKGLNIVNTSGYYQLAILGACAAFMIIVILIIIELVFKFNNKYHEDTHQNKQMN